MRDLVLIVFVGLSLGAFGQPDSALEDSIRGQRMIETISQLDLPPNLGFPQFS